MFCFFWLVRHSCLFIYCIVTISVIVIRDSWEELYDNFVNNKTLWFKQHETSKWFELKFWSDQDNHSLYVTTLFNGAGSSRLAPTPHPKKTIFKMFWPDDHLEEMVHSLFLMHGGAPARWRPQEGRFVGLQKAKALHLNLSITHLQIKTGVWVQK